MCDLSAGHRFETSGVPIPEYLLSTFEAIWRELLAGEQPRRICVLEPACGSANDYRFLDTFGIARLLDYVGFDLCEKNIVNASGMFPGVRFKVGNVLEIDAATAHTTTVLSMICSSIYPSRPWKRQSLKYAAWHKRASAPDSSTCTIAMRISSNPLGAITGIR